MDFKLDLQLFNCDINNANIDTLAKEYNTPIEVYEYADFLNGRLILPKKMRNKFYQLLIRYLKVKIT